MKADDSTVYRVAGVDHEASPDVSADVEEGPAPGLRVRSALPPLAGRPTEAPVQGVVTGRLIGFLRGQPLVTRPDGGNPLLARTTIDLTTAHIEREVLLAFDEGRPDRPVILGWIRGDGLPPEIQEAAGRTAGTVEIDVDGMALRITAKERLTLQCGDASITMTKAGKILIQGRYISSLSSGVNRIKGGSVQIN